MTAHLQPRLPAQPLADVAALRRLELTGLPADLRRAFHRARKDGDLTVWAADRIAVEVLGVHPVCVWGDAYLDRDHYEYFDEPDEFGALPQPITLEAAS